MQDLCELPKYWWQMKTLVPFGITKTLLFSEELGYWGTSGSMVGCRCSVSFMMVFRYRILSTSASSTTLSTPTTSVMVQGLCFQQHLCHCSFYCLGCRICYVKHHDLWFTSEKVGNSFCGSPLWWTWDDFLSTNTTVRLPETLFFALTFSAKSHFSARKVVIFLEGMKWTSTEPFSVEPTTKHTLFLSMLSFMAKFPSTYHVIPFSWENMHAVSLHS